MKHLSFNRFHLPLNCPCLAAVVVAGILGGIALPCAAQIYTPPQNGLVGWWSGNGDATDSSGNGHNGTIQGEGFTTGLYGQAFASDSNQRVFIPDSAGFQLTGSLTIAAWINMTSPSYIILQRGDERPGLDPWQLSGNGQGAMGINIEDASDNAAYAYATIPLNQWVQVTGTLDASTGDLRFYIDGVLASELFTSIRPFANLDPTQNPGVGLGNNPQSDINFPFVGSIDEVLLYNRALSPEEVASLVPEPGTASMLVFGGLLMLGVRQLRGRKLEQLN